MKRSMWLSTFVAAACAVGLAAQPPTPDQTSRQTPDMSKQVKITGCVERATGDTAGGTTGTSGSSASATRWILANASMSPASETTTTGGTTAGGTAAGTTAGTMPAQRYRLDTDDAKVSAHAGHKVEITGTVEETMTSSAPSTAGTTGGTRSSSVMSEPRLKVDSVRMIAATCP